MQLNALRNDDWASNIDAQSFKVEMNSMMFYSVINGIYADKIRSPMRELATNARDGHVAAGKLDVPFDVKLPTIFDPNFSVRDYGCSMSHADIMGLYSTMFASSKRDDNSAVGMIGLGSKSPFAYTSSFSVTAWLDGERRVYVVSIGADDVPQIGLVSAEPSDEPTGIEVSFAVQMKDVETFRSAAPIVFFGFDPKPNLINMETEYPEPKLSGDNWAIYHKHDFPWGDKAMARQGCVIYPLDPDALAPRLRDNPLFKLPVLIDYPIGQLSVNTSREALGYDELTVANIEKRLDEILTDMTTMVQEELDACESYLHACDLLHKKRVTDVIWKILGQHLTFRGEPLKLEFKIQQIGNEHRARMYEWDHHWIGSPLAGASFTAIRKAYPISLEPGRLLKTTLIMEVEKASTKTNMRVRRAFSELPKGQRAIWIKAKTQSHAEHLVNILGRPTTVFITDQIEPLALPKRDKKSRPNVATLKQLNYTGVIPRLVNLDDIKELVYVEYAGQRVYPRGDHGSYYSATKVGMWVESHMDTLNTKFDVYILRNDQIWRLREKGVNLVKYHDKLRSLLPDRAEYLAYLQRRALNLPYNMTNAISRIASAPDSVKPLIPANLTEFVRRYQERTGPVETFITESISQLTSFLPEFIPNSVNNPYRNEVLGDWEALMEQYPLLYASIDNEAKLQHYMELLSK